MKKRMAVLGLAILCVVGIFAVSSTARANNGAEVSHEVCTTTDGAGNVVVLTKHIRVVTNSENNNRMFTCSGKDVAPGPDGKALVVSGQLCFSGGHVTEHSHKVITPSGNITLTCTFKD